MDSYPKICVHVVNYNGGQYLPRCLESVQRQDYPGPLEIMVVDNASRDNSLVWVKEHCPEARILENQQNLGFAKAHNQAIRATDGWAVLVLNFDVVLNHDYVRRTVDNLRTDSTVGSVAGKLYRMDNGGPTKILDSTGIGMRLCFASDRGQAEEDRGQFDNDFWVFGACGAAPLYRRAMLEDIAFRGEYFDEDFANYVEDVDLAWRAQLLGWRCRYEPQAVGYHERGVTRRSDAQERYRYLLIGYRNRYWTIWKNLPAAQMRRSFFKILVNETAFLFGGRPEGQERGLARKALRRALGKLPVILKKRAWIQKRRKASPDALAPFWGFSDFDATGLVRQYARSFVCRRWRREARS